MTDILLKNAIVTGKLWLNNSVCDIKFRSSFVFFKMFALGALSQCTRPVLEWKFHPSLITFYLCFLLTSELLKKKVTEVCY